MQTCNQTLHHTTGCSIPNLQKSINYTDRTRADWVNPAGNNSHQPPAQFLGNNHVQNCL
jgi:hypothetical protein